MTRLFIDIESRPVKEVIHGNGYTLIVFDEVDGGQFDPTQITATYQTPYHCPSYPDFDPFFEPFLPCPPTRTDIVSLPPIAPRAQVPQRGLPLVPWFTSGFV